VGKYGSLLLAEVTDRGEVELAKVFTGRRQSKELSSAIVHSEMLTLH
jgi:hypothetical protein